MTLYTSRLTISELTHTYRLSQTTEVCTRRCSGKWRGFAFGDNYEYNKGSHPSIRLLIENHLYVDPKRTSGSRNQRSSCRRKSRRAWKKPGTFVEFPLASVTALKILLV